MNTTEAYYALGCVPGARRDPRPIADGATRPPVDAVYHKAAQTQAAIQQPGVLARVRAGLPKGGCQGRCLTYGCVAMQILICWEKLAPIRESVEAPPPRGAIG